MRAGTLPYTSHCLSRDPISAIINQSLSDCWPHAADCFNANVTGIAHEGTALLQHPRDTAAFRHYICEMQSLEWCPVPTAVEIYLFLELLQSFSVLKLLLLEL